MSRNLPLAFAEVLGGGIVLLAGLSGRSLGDVMSGKFQLNPFVSLTGNSLSTFGADASGSGGAQTARPVTSGKRAIDIWYQSAQELGLSGLDPVDVTINGVTTRVYASVFGGPSDPGTGSSGYKGDNLYQHPDSFAELSNNYGAPLSQLDYSALGGLPYGAAATVTNPANGRSKVLYKRDIGAGGPA